MWRSVYLYFGPYRTFQRVCFITSQRDENIAKMESKLKSCMNLACVLPGALAKSRITVSLHELRGLSVVVIWVDIKSTSIHEAMLEQIIYGSPSTAMSKSKELNWHHWHSILRSKIWTVAKPLARPFDAMYA